MNTAIPKKLKPFFLAELKEYKSEMQKDNLHKAWQHLEKAHVIGQAYPYEHSYVHWKMLLFGIHIKNGKEILGQIPRLIFGGVKSFVGTIPVGNTGGANVPPLRPLPISEEIQVIFEKAGVKR
ncbi:MAG: DUF3703 domain-containing protein [Vicingaceae bacterium]